MKLHKIIDFIKELQIGDIIVKDGVFLKESEQTGAYLRTLPVVIKVLNIQESTTEMSKFKEVSKGVEYSRLALNSEYTETITVKTLIITTQEVEKDDYGMWVITPMEQVFPHWENPTKLIEDWFNQSKMNLNTYDLIIRPQQVTNSLYY